MGASQSSILEAASVGDVKTLRTLLLSDGLNARATDGNGWNALHIAVFQGHGEFATELLASKFGEQLLEVMDERGRTPLHLAAAQNHSETAAALLRCGASYLKKDGNGLLPIHRAAFCGAVATLRVLIAHGSRPDIAIEDGMTPLHFAAWKGSVECIKVLLSAGAQVDVRNDKGGTPLHEAAASGNAAAVRALLKGGGRSAADARDERGRRPIDVAAENGHDQAARELRAAEGGILRFLSQKLGALRGPPAAGTPADGDGDGDGGWGEERCPTDWDGRPLRPAAEQRHQEPPQPVGAALGSASAGTESGETAAADAPSDAGGRGPGGCAALDDGGWGGPVPCGDDGWGSPLPSPRRTAESAAVLAAQGRAEDSLRSPTTPAGPPAAPAGCEGTSGEAKGDPGPAAPPHRAARGASPSGDPPAESGAASASSGIAVRKEGFEPSAPPAEELGISPGATGRDDLLESQRQEIEELRAALERAKLGSSGPPAPSAPPMPDLPPIPTCEMFTFQELHEATGGFAPSNRLGAGGFGEVFRGVLRSHTRVAVKRLTANSMQGPEALWREVGVLSRVRHPHLVLLLGACPEHGCIVYELMEGGSLQDALSPAGSGREPLEWQDRVRIAAEMATALLVLHQAQPQPILHRDFKPANVLLDAHLTAKLADVGLARIAPELGPGRSHVVDTTPVGTFDYIDPEYLHTGRFAPASDTYSLGVALLQLLTGRPPRGSDGRTLHDAVRTLCASRMVHDAVDPSSVRKTRWPLEDARAFAELALQCCAYNRRDRPPLIEVVGLLRDLAARAHREASECARRQHGELGGQMGQRVTPAMFLCPITREVMEDPVVAADGFTYERVAIQAWLERGRDRSPMSNARLPHRELTPNHTLRSAIREWLEGGSGRLSEA